MSNIHKALQERILVLDGAMGTMLQAYKFSEEDFRGDRFKDYPTPLQVRNQKQLKPFMENILKLVQIL